MKTIRQIAKEIGVSKQAVFYKISKPPLLLALQPLVSKENGILTVSLDGEKLIKQAFNDSRSNFKPSKENASLDGNLIEILRTTINTLSEQLSQKDSQITALTAAVKAQAESVVFTPLAGRFQVTRKCKRKKTSVPINRLLAKK
ncbi:MAG: hypothetical protein FWC09_00335 [Lachnospiraceae bacterium]|nr:hypothetical protein [Lachnospiraceae bacterium]